MRAPGDFSPYRPIDFDVRGTFCDDDCKVHPDLLALGFKVTGVHGTSPRVAVGERYIVRGEYALPTGSALYVVSLAVFHTSVGAGAHVAPGEGPFETSIDILELAKESPNGLGVVVANKTTGKSEIVRWVMLKAEP